jgi:hypothetical protein
MKSELWRILSETDEYFAINEFTESKKKNTTRFCAKKRVEWFENSNKSKD